MLDDETTERNESESSGVGEGLRGEAASGGDEPEALGATPEEVDAAPQRPTLDNDDKRTALQAGVKAALQALPGEFQFRHTVSGIAATDLFNLNTFLGAGIEMEVVRTLNALRHIWDPQSIWASYRFERSSQAFPDVRLISAGVYGADEIALGVELKGWWMLAKEGVPSLRYQVSPNACAPHDLVCVVPWHLSNAVSGEAIAAEPWVESALYAAEWRDYWWQHVREVAENTNTSISYPSGAAPYPSKADRVTAVPAYDGGDNYGRLPRCRPLMDQFVSSTMAVPILGIEARAWVKFLRLHTDSVDPNLVAERLQRQLRSRDRKVSSDRAEGILHQLDEISRMLP